MTSSDALFAALPAVEGIEGTSTSNHDPVRVFVIEGKSSRLAALATMLARQGFDVTSFLADAALHPQPEVRSGVVPSDKVTCGRLVLDLEHRLAWWDGTEVPLTAGELDIVALLASNAGCYMNYRSVYDCLHYQGFQSGVGDKGYWTNVRSMIRRVRRKFQAIDSDFAEVENSSGFGYRWRRAG